MSSCIRTASRPTSRDRTRSPKTASRKREFFKGCSETFGNLVHSGSHIRNLETGRDSKSRLLAGLWSALKEYSLKRGLDGWRRSGIRTRLRRISLLTGNFTGKFAIPDPKMPTLEQERAASQLLIEQFPKQKNREEICKNREYLSVEQGN